MKLKKAKRIFATSMVTAIVIFFLSLIKNIISFLKLNPGAWVVNNPRKYIYRALAGAILTVWPTLTGIGQVAVNVIPITGFYSGFFYAAPRIVQRPTIGANTVLPLSRIQRIRPRGCWSPFSQGLRHHALDPGI
jgi:hypothetical protein